MRIFLEAIVVLLVVLKILVKRWKRIHVIFAFIILVKFYTFDRNISSTIADAVNKDLETSWSNNHFPKVLGVN